MKKIIALLVIVITTFSLSSCFLFGGVTTHPNMVEYTEREVLEVAEQKYGVTEWIFFGMELRGEAGYDTEGTFKVDLYDEQFGTEFVGGDNIEKAFSSFAGKNGNHDVQGMYSSFLCCVALGERADGSLKFVYYNTNIHKDAKIFDTVGASDYTFEVLPTEITSELLTVDSRWTAMQLFLNDFKNGLVPAGFVYSGERLITRRYETSYSYVELEFYKERGEVVYDIYYTKDEKKPRERRLVFSTSDRYGVIYNYYGLDKSEYFDITTTVTQSTEQESCMTLRALVEAKEIEGNVLYSRLLYSAEYYVKKDKGPVLHGTASETVTDKLEFECGWMLDKIDGIDHAETAKFYLSHFYIFYEKNRKAE